MSNMHSAFLIFIHIVEGELLVNWIADDKMAFVGAYIENSNQNYLIWNIYIYNPWWVSTQSC